MAHALLRTPARISRPDAPGPGRTGQGFRSSGVHPPLYSSAPSQGTVKHPSTAAAPVRTSRSRPMLAASGRAGLALHCRGFGVQALLKSLAFLRGMNQKLSSHWATPKSLRPEVRVLGQALRGSIQPVGISRNDAQPFVPPDALRAPVNSNVSRLFMPSLNSPPDVAVVCAPSTVVHGGFAVAGNVVRSQAASSTAQSLEINSRWLALGPETSFVAAHLHSAAARFGTQSPARLQTANPSIKRTWLRQAAYALR